MKNTIKGFGIIICGLIIGFSMVSCDDSGDSGDFDIQPTNGELTITFFGSYSLNGKYVVVASGGSDNNIIVAADNITSNGIVKGGLVSNDQVKLKVWKVIDEKTLGNYDGSEYCQLAWSVLDKSSLTEEDMMSLPGGEELTGFIGSGYEYISFENGNGTISVNTDFLDDDFLDD